jgi:hypothetical protein
MKRLIFILIAFTCGLSASIAADVGTRSTDMLQPEFVISQITPMPVINAVVFEMATTIQPTAGVYLFSANADVKLVTFKPDTWRNPDYGPSLLYSNVIRITNGTTDYNYSYTPYLLQNYRYGNGYTHNIRSTTRHVIFS